MRNTGEILKQHISVEFEVPLSLLEDASTFRDTLGFSCHQVSLVESLCQSLFGTQIDIERTDSIGEVLKKCQN